MTSASAGPGSAVRTVAAFDFDGTITRRDTLVPFLALVAGRARTYLAVARRGVPLALALLGLGSRDEEKERVVASLLAGFPVADLVEWGERYAATLAEERPFRPDILDRLRWHRSEGHEIVIVSASLAVYLTPLASRLGVDHVIATDLETGPDGRLTGRLVGGNVRGAEKERRLRAWLGTGPVELWAYGDSRGDREMLAMAQHARRVGR